MKMKKLLIAILGVSALAAVSCAVDPEEDSYASYDRVMEAWINTHFPGVKPYGTEGAYILDMSQGAGPAVTDSSYVWAHYVKRTLEGTVISTNIMELAEQLGTYSNASFYGSDIWRVDQGYLPVSLEEVLKTMRSGGRASIAIPYSASNHEVSTYAAFSGTDEGTNVLIDLTIDTVVTDIMAWQDRAMKEWFQSRYPGTDTVSTGLYFTKLEEHTAETDTIADGEEIKVRYIGRLLNGQVFDTNIQDTAKFYRIWDGSRSYDALSFTYHKPDTENLASDNGVVEGFAQAVARMNYGEKAVTLFRSDLGYGESGSGDFVPEYAPLIFWLYVEPEE